MLVTVVIPVTLVIPVILVIPTLAKRLVENFWSLFQSHFAVRTRGHWTSFCVKLVVQLFYFDAARIVDYFVVTEITFMDNQAQFTETVD